MKRLLNILMMFAVIACAVSCKPDDNPVAEQESLNGIKTAYTIGAEGGSLEMQVSANVDFTVTPADSWVKYTTTKAVETKTIVVTVEPNTSTDRRSTKVTVKGKEKQIEITITQEGATPAEPDVLEAGTTTYSVPAEGGEVNVAVTTNVEMTVTTDSGWIKYTSTKAASQKTVCFTVDANTAYEARSGKATISGGDKTVEIVFNQAAKPEEPDLDKLTVAQTEYTIGAEGGNVEVKVNTNCDEVKATVDQTWVKFFGTKARAFADRTLTFSVLANTTTEERTVTATITAGTETATVTIKQAAASAEPSEDPVLAAGQATYNLPAEGGSFVVDVTTNVDYTVSCDAMWLRKTATKATRTDHITYMATPNTGEARTAKISFNYGEITVVVTVNQAAYEAPAEEPVLEVSATEFQVAAEGEELNVKVTHNYDYTVSGNPEWVVVDVDGDDCFITVAENTGTEVRLATLEFASEGVTKTVTIAQDASEESGDPLNVGPDLSVNETANTYVVTKAGDYTFSAAVMGNGPEGYLDAWVDSQELLGASQSFYLWPTDDPNLVTFTKSDLKKAKAAIIWEEGDCIDGEPKYNSTSKTIGFKANGNEGGALIALYNQYEDVLWSWLIWCTDRPAECTFTNSDGDQVQMMDRNLGATSATPSDGSATYGYVFNFGRKDPIRMKNDIAHTEFMNNSTKEYSETVLNPTKAFMPVGRDIEYFNGSVGTLTPDLWGDPYLPCSFALRQNYDQTEIADVKKTIYDPCPPGYQVPPARVYDNIKMDDIHLVSNLGVNIDVTGGSAYFPFSGYCDGGNQHGGNNGYYGYTGYVRGSGDFDRSDELCIKVWTATEGDYPGTDGNWLGGQAFCVHYDEAANDLYMVQHPDSNLGISRNEHAIRVRLHTVRCMRYVDR